MCRGCWIAAAAAGVKPEDVTIETTFLGGGFGRKLELDFIRQAAEISRAAGMPVKMLWTKEDDITHDFYRPMSVHHMEATRGVDGQLTAMKAKMVSQSVTARAFPGFVKDGFDPFMTEGSNNLTYGIPNLEITNVIEEKSGYRAGTKKFGVAQMECYDTYSACIVELDTTTAETKVKKVTFASDCGITIHPDQARAQLTGGVIYGLGAALSNEITIKNGRVQQSNFNNYPSLRQNQVPVVEVHLVSSQEKPGGLGEVGVPLVAPALVNAIAAATGKRIRELPIKG